MRLPTKDEMYKVSMDITTLRNEELKKKFDSETLPLIKNAIVNASRDGKFGVTFQIDSNLVQFATDELVKNGYSVNVRDDSVGFVKNIIIHWGDNDVD